MTGARQQRRLLHGRVQTAEAHDHQYEAERRDVQPFDGDHPDQTERIDRRPRQPRCQTGADTHPGAQQQRPGVGVEETGNDERDQGGDEHQPTAGRVGPDIDEGEDGPDRGGDEGRTGDVYHRVGEHRARRDAGERPIHGTEAGPIPPSKVSHAKVPRGAATNAATTANRMRLEAVENERWRRRPTSGHAVVNRSTPGTAHSIALHPW